MNSMNSMNNFVKVPGKVSIEVKEALKAGVDIKQIQRFKSSSQHQSDEHSGYTFTSNKPEKETIDNTQLLQPTRDEPFNQN